MSTAKKILGNTVWQVAGRGVMAVASIVIMKAVSHFLSVEGYGAYTAVYEFLAFFGIAADFGLFTIGVREISRGEKERNFVVQNIFGMRLFTATLMMGLAVVCVFFMPKYEGTFIPLGVTVAAIAVFLAILQGTVSSILQVELKMQYATIGLVAGKIISMFWILAVVSVFYVGEPTQGAFNQLMLAGVVGNLFAFLYTFYYALRFANLRPQFCRAYWKEILVGAFPYGLALMFNAIYFRVDSLLLLQFKGVKELGFYGPPMRILEILNVIPVYFMNSVLPVLSKEIREGGAATLGFDPAAGETGKAVRIIQLCFNFLFLAGLPMAIGLYILAYPIIFMVAQPEFLSRLSEGIYGSDVALQILVVSMFFAFLNSVFNYALIALSKQNFLLWINGGAAVVNVLINVAVIPLWGFRGAAITSIFTEIFILAAAYLCARRFIKFRFDFLALLKISGAGAVMGAVVWLLRDPSYGWLGMQNLNVLFLTAIGATVYGGLIWLMKVVPREISSRDV